MKRNSWLRSNTPLNPVNRERKDRLHERNFGLKAHWIREQPCEVTGTHRNVVAAHGRARGMGGCGGSKEHLVPLSSRVHHDFDTMPEAKFEAKYGRTKQSVRDTARHYEEQWRKVEDEYSRDLNF